MSQPTVSMIGVSAISEHRARWAEAAPKMAMAFCEAGYPCTFERWSLVSPTGENEIRFLGEVPPLEVIVRAAELCGIREVLDRDLVRARLPLAPPPNS